MSASIRSFHIIQDAYIYEYVCVSPGGSRSVLLSVHAFAQSNLHATPGGKTPLDPSSLASDALTDVAKKFYLNPGD